MRGSRWYPGTAAQLPGLAAAQPALAACCAPDAAGAEKLPLLCCCMHATACRGRAAATAHASRVTLPFLMR